MIAFYVVCGLFAVVWTLDALRLRARIGALAVLSPSDAATSDEHRFVVRAGATLDDATRRAASAFARAHDLDVVDLVAPDLPAWRALLFLQTVDASRFRAERLAKGRTAGDAILVSAPVLAQIEPRLASPTTAVEMAELAAKLHQHACTRMTFALAPGLRSAGGDFGERRALLRYAYGDLAPPIVVLQIAIALAGPLLGGIPGIAAFTAMHLQLALATIGTRLRPRDLLVTTLFRAAIDLVSVLAPARRDRDTARTRARDAVAERRPIYDALLARGTPAFFEARRDDCPICGSKALSLAHRMRDRYQFKPGDFTLDRCSGCQHVFQNPRLSIAGLDFYYRDFYDGLGADALEGIFSAEIHSYRARAQIVAAADVPSPSRWLDVGAGHGHFCCIARDVWPSARFDGLDMSESIEEAARRKWVDAGYRGLFPELAPQIAEDGAAYDVVSMSHYLEHTRDPGAEIEAAGKVLPRGGGGLLLIEVPDPESRMGKVLGSYWMPWFQPQHQHFLSAKNLERLLRAHAFEPVVWHRGEAHQPCDLTFFAYTLLNQIARPIDRPWRPPTRLVMRAWNRIVWWTGIPLLGVAWILDRVSAPLFRRAGWSNTYRVLARRTA